MKQEQSLVFGDYAKRRMIARGLTDAHVWFCKFNQTNSYKVGEEMVWECKLPDGRGLKVRVRDTSANPIFVVDVFTYR